MAFDLVASLAEASPLSIGLSIAIILGTTLAAYYAFEVYSYKMQAKAWLAIALGLVLIIFRRTIGMFVIFNFLPMWNQEMQAVEEMILVANTLLFAWGFYSLNKELEECALACPRLEKRKASEGEKGK